MNFEQDFIERLIRKDKNAFNELYLQTVDMFYGYIKSNYFIADSDAEDIVSNFYLKLWTGIDKFQYMKNFSSWMRTIFKNTIKDEFKKSKEKHFSNYESDENEAIEDTLISTDNVHEFLQLDFEMNNIKLAFEKLDESSKEVVYFKFIKEMTNKEISQLLGITEENVRQRVSRGIKKLKELLNTD